MSQETTGAKFRKYSQSEANYVMESGVANQHCASCRWYMSEGEMAFCHLVEGYPQPIVATGHSDFYAPYPEPEPLFEEVMEKFTEEITETRESVMTKFINSVKALLGDKPVELDGMGFKAIGNKWIAIWTNNFEDHSGEFFEEKAIDDFIARVDSKEADLPALWFWHLPLEIGKAEWLGRHHHMAMAAGHFNDDPISRAFKDYFNSIEAAYKVSHGYMYAKQAKQRNIYTSFTTFEISPLPDYAPDNPYTYFGGMKMLTKEKEAELRKILPSRMADAAIKAAEIASKEIEDMGVASKDKPEVIDTEARQGIKEVQNMLTELDAKLDKAMKKPDEDDEDAAKKKKADADKDAAYKKELGALETQVKAMNEKLSQFLELEPRRSSKAKETEIKEDNPLLKEAKEGREGEESQRITQTVFGGMFGHGG